MDTGTLESEDLAKLALGGRARKNTRIRRALVARLLNEQSGGGEDEDYDDTAEGGDDRELARLIAGSRLLRKRRFRRLVLAHLLNEGGSEAGEGEYDEEDSGADENGDGGTSDAELGRLLVASRMLRRRRVRRALLAHIIRENAGGDEDIDEGEEEFDEDGGRDGAFVRMVIASRVLRRRRVRKAVIAHLLKERGSDDSGDDEDSDDGDLARLAVGRRMSRRRRMRRALIARLREDAD